MYIGGGGYKSSATSEPSTLIRLLANPLNTIMAPSGEIMWTNYSQGPYTLGQGGYTGVYGLVLLVSDLELYLFAVGVYALGVNHVV